MMELFSSPKAEYLLEASLGTLHAESREWMSAIDFWREEMPCFYKLLRKNANAFAFPPEELAEIEKEMIRINSDELVNIKSRVEHHERALASIVKSTSPAEEGEYRHEHRAITNDVYALQQVIRKFKKEVFSLVKES